MKPNETDNQEQGGLPAAGEVLEQPQSMPLGVGNFEEQVAIDPLSGDGGARKRIDSGSLLIVIVIIVAAAGLFSMRTLAKVAVPSAGASELDETIEGFLRMLNVPGGEQSNQVVDIATDSVLGIINEEYTERQVPLADVQRNPFIIWTPIIRMPDQPAGGTVDHLWEQQRTEREGHIRDAAERFVLKSVLMGSTPLANLSDKIVRVGEGILVQPEGVEFRVTAINPGSVTLLAEEPRLELAIQIEVVLIRE